MKFGQHLRRAELSFNDKVGLDLSFVSYKNLKKLLKRVLENYKLYNDWQEGQSEYTLTEVEEFYLESAEKFMGVLCQDILEVAWVYDSHIKSCSEKERFYLQAYAFLNTEAVRKICKKFDKHVPGEEILNSMMKKLKIQNFFADIQILGPQENIALRQLLAGEGFEEATLPWPSLLTGFNQEWTTPGGIENWGTTPDWISKKEDFSDNESAASQEVKPVTNLEAPRPPQNENELPNHHSTLYSLHQTIPTPHTTPTTTTTTTTVPTTPSGGYNNRIEPQMGQSALLKPNNNLLFPPDYSFNYLPAVPQSLPPAEPYRFGGDPNWNKQPDNRFHQDPWSKRDPVRHNAHGGARHERRPQHSPPNYLQPSHETWTDNDGGIDANDGNLIINYLPNEWSEIELLALFSPFGEILSARIVRERFSRRSKGFGFVKFTGGEEAERAIHAMNGRIMSGKQIKVSFAKARRSRAKANLFVSRFPSDWTSVALKKLFESFGEIAECRVLRTLNGESKRCGFVRFETEQSGLQAIISLNSSILPGEKCRLRVKIADRERYQHMKKQKAMFSNF